MSRKIIKRKMINRYFKRFKRKKVIARVKQRVELLTIYRNTLLKLADELREDAEPYTLMGNPYPTNSDLYVEYERLQTQGLALADLSEKELEPYL